MNVLNFILNVLIDNIRIQLSILFLKTRMSYCYRKSTSVNMHEYKVKEKHVLIKRERERENNELIITSIVNVVIKDYRLTEKVREHTLARFSAM